MTDPNRTRTRRLAAILLDFGDTLSDQGTEVRDDTDTMVAVDLRPGARETVVALRERGYPLALVVDGAEDLYTVMRQHDLEGLFDAVALSKEVGVRKPDARMFRTALDALGVEEADYPRTVMVGNRLDRDVLGARSLGLVAVWLDASPRDRKTPATPLEVPDHVIGSPPELLALVERLETG